MPHPSLRQICSSVSSTVRPGSPQVSLPSFWSFQITVFSVLFSPTVLLLRPTGARGNVHRNSRKETTRLKRRGDRYSVFHEGWVVCRGSKEYRTNAPSELGFVLRTAGPVHRSLSGRTQSPVVSRSVDTGPPTPEEYLSTLDPGDARR